MTHLEQLRHEILMARQRIYAISGPTPMDAIDLSEDNIKLFLKREDMGPIHAYKWRGAYNRMAHLSPEELKRGIVTASAGNHAQGVALAARKLSTRATIVMPLPTPKTKINAVRLHGAEAVEIILKGDTYDEASEYARNYQKETGMAYVHAYDHIQVMAGQGTMADEIVMSGEGPFDIAYLQIGGGGMAAGVAAWLKSYYPNIEIVGVEGIDQAGMKAAVESGHPVTLDYVDVFCDGTAVKRVGDLTFPLCKELIDRFITVTNEEVCAAIQMLWELRRCIPEPAGAMGLAGFLKEKSPEMQGKKVICIICGANMDFGQLAWVSRHAGIGGHKRRFLRFQIEEKSGSLLKLLVDYLDPLNIIEFQYGKTDAHRAWPVIGIEASDADIQVVKRTLDQSGLIWEEVTGDADVEFRMIHYQTHLMRDPLFIQLEFHERAGALHDFLKSVGEAGNLCYFNYSYSGERVGRALIGFEFNDPEARINFFTDLVGHGKAYRSCHEIAEDVVSRIL